MKTIYFLMFSFASNCFAQENSTLSVKLAEKLKLTASCELAVVGRGYYINMCPAGSVMTGATAIPGSSSIQVLCSTLEIRCQ